MFSGAALAAGGVRAMSGVNLGNNLVGVGAGAAACLERSGMAVGGSNMDRGAAASSNVGPVREGSIRGEGERSNGLDRTTADRDRMAGLDRWIVYTSQPKKILSIVGVKELFLFQCSFFLSDQQPSNQCSIVVHDFVLAGCLADCPVRSS